MDAPSLYDGHGTKVLLLASFVSKPGISTSHLYVMVTQKLLEAFQAHAGI